MGLSLAQGTFTKRSGNGTQDVVISPAFTPKIILFWGLSRELEGGFNSGSAYFGGTSGTAVAQNRCISTRMADDQATSIATTRISDLAISIRSIATFASLGDAVLSSFNSDGFTLSWTNSNTAAYIIHYIALGGSDLSNVIVGDKTWATATGNQAFTGVGFQPNFIFVYGGGNNAGTIPFDVTEMQLSFGAALSTTSRWTVVTAADDADTMSPFVAGRRLVTTAMASELNDAGSAVLAAADFVSFNSDGWTWNVTTAPAAAAPFIFVAFNFANVTENVAIGTFDKCTTGGCTSDVTTNQDTPKGVLLFSRDDVAGTTILDDARMAVGGSDFSNEGSVSVHHQETTGGNTNVNQFISSTKALVTVGTGTTSTNEADASSIANGFRTTWTTNDGVATTIAYIAFGEAAAGGAAEKNFLTLCGAGA